MASQHNMKTSLLHLPPPMQEQARRMLEILLAGDPDLVILFGSRARGDWVEDQQTHYYSDWDILVVTRAALGADDEARWDELERQARAVADKGPVNLLLDDIDTVNHEIRQGNYLFGDILKEGVLLHDSGQLLLARPKSLTQEERLERAQRNFIQWMGSAQVFGRMSRVAQEMRQLKHAAFLLHQAAERYYVAALLVHQGYKPKLHDIEKLDKIAKKQEVPILWPREEADERHLFKLLRRAYIEARYNPQYKITEQELEVLQERVKQMAERVRAVCEDRMALFCGREAVRADLWEAVEAEAAQGMPAEALSPEGLRLLAYKHQWLDQGEWQGRQQGRQQGLDEGKRLGLDEGKRLGLDEGERRGERKAQQAAILSVLEARGLPLSEAVRAAILGCTDHAQLARWVTRAVTVASADEVIAEA